MITNSGIQMFALKLSINLQDRFGLWFHEWYDTDEGQWKLDFRLKLEAKETFTVIGWDDKVSYMRMIDLYDEIIKTVDNEVSGF